MVFQGLETNKGTFIEALTQKGKAQNADSDNPSSANGLYVFE